MHFSAFMSVLAATSVFSVVNGFATTSTYDNTYDNPAGSLNGVACSNGVNGLVTKGFTTFSSLPSFPHIGGAMAVTGWNSTKCGSCWALTFNQTKTINVLAIDTSANGFNIAQKALDELTNNQAVALGRVPITAVEVDPSACGL
ncbi:Cerato-platanin [Gautieria morchelliformis]|nr:Cerato-platanin [Gautieria morchelliformis]